MKRKFLLFLALFTFFFMKNNTFADTTCTYSMSNVMRKVIAFNADGTVKDAGGAASMLSDSKDHNLVMTIKSLPTGVTPSSVSGLKDYLSFKVDSKDKFEISLNDYSIYQYKVSGSSMNAYNALLKCPPIGIVYHQRGSADKYTIDNITSITEPTESDLPGIMKPYSKGANDASTSSRIICVYGSTSDQPFKAQIQLEMNGTTGTKSVFRIVTGDNPPYQAAASKSVFRINDYNPAPEVSGVKIYKCNEYGYFDFTSDDEIYPSSYKITNSTRQLEFKKSYHLPGSVFYSKISLYDANTNSGASGNPELPGTKSYCSTHPDTLVCKTKYSSTNTIFSFCNDAGMLKTFKIIHIFIVIAKILVPILLIIFGSIDYGKAALADNQDAIEKTTQALIKKVIVGLLIFFIPTIVDAIVGYAQSGRDKSDKTGEFKKCALCFVGDSECDSYIKGASTGK